MSVQTVLFDLPGPKARARHRIIAVVGGVAIVALLVAMGWALRAQLAPAKWEPFVNPVTWTAYIVPGLVATLVGAALSVVLAGILGLVLGMGRLSHNKLVAAASGIFVEFFRSVPVLMMMIFSFYAFVYSGILTGPTASLAGVVTGLTFYNACVIAELVRSGVHSLPNGQTEAGLAVGLTRQQTLRMILLPQAIRAMLPALVSQLIVVLKDTALGTMILYPELLQAAQRLAAVHGNIIAGFLVITGIFVLINWGLAVLAEKAQHWVATRQAGEELGTAGREVIPVLTDLHPVEPTPDEARPDPFPKTDPRQY